MPLRHDNLFLRFWDVNSHNSDLDICHLSIQSVCIQESKNINFRMISSKEKSGVFEDNEFFSDGKE